MYSVPTQRLHEVMKIMTKVIKPSRHFHTANFAAVEISSGGNLRVTATDLDTVIRVSTSGFDAAQASRIDLETKPLADLVAGCYRASKRSSLTLKADGAVESGQMSALIATQESKEFPNVPALAYDDARQRVLFLESTDALNFLRGLSVVESALCNEESRFTLNGAYLGPVDGTAGGWDLVATDSHRLARRRVYATAFDGDQRQPILIPAAIVRAILKIGITSHAQVSSFEDHITIGFDCGDLAILLIAKKMTGTFPDYQRIMPRETGPIRCYFTPAFMSAALAQIKPVIGKRGAADNGISLTVDGNGGVAIAAKSGGRSASAAVTAAEGVGIGTVILNFYYLLDLCQSYAQASNGQIGGAFELNDKGNCVSAVAFRPRESSVPEYLLMPMRA